MISVVTLGALSYLEEVLLAISTRTDSGLIHSQAASLPLPGLLAREHARPRERTRDPARPQAQPPEQASRLPAEGSRIEQSQIPLDDLVEPEDLLVCNPGL